MFFLGSRGTPNSEDKVAPGLGLRHQRISERQLFIRATLEHVRWRKERQEATLFLIKYGNLSERMGNKNDNHHLYLVAMLYQHEGSRLRTVDDKRARGRNRSGRVKKSIGRWSDGRRQFDCDSGARQALGVLTSWEVLVGAEKTEFNLH